MGKPRTTDSYLCNDKEIELDGSRPMKLSWTDLSYVIKEKSKQKKSDNSGHGENIKEKTLLKTQSGYVLEL